MTGSVPSRSVSRFNLTGPTIVLDPRTHAYRPDLADIALADRVFAPHYASPRYQASVVGVMLRDRPDALASAVSQLACGEAFTVVDQAGGWAWGYGRHDDYVGYVPAAALGSPIRATYVVSASLAPVFSKASIKSAVSRTLTIGARVAGVQRGDFVALEDGFVHLRHVASLDAREADPVAVAERLLGAPYLWGGRGDGGVDCSGLVQRAYGLAGVALPRDSDQQRDVGTGLAEDARLRRGDLILFPGHVGMMVDEHRLIHANAHWMAVTIEPLDTVVARGAPIVARRRIQA